MGHLRLAVLLLASLGTMAGAQQDRAIVVVSDTLGNRIPFAFVQLVQGASRVANDSGRVILGMAPRDSLRLSVRRMGFEPFIGWALRGSDGEYHVRLAMLPRTLGEVTIEARRNTVLARTGFYDRLDRTQSGAYSARFFTPEELDLRNPAKVSQVLAGESMIRIQHFRGRPILVGRGNQCGYTVLLDGRVMLGMMESTIGDRGQQELLRATQGAQGDPGRKEAAVSAYMSTLTSVDDLIGGASVAGIEVYGSIAAAPVELQRRAGRGVCGIIAIWSGARK